MIDIGFEWDDGIMRCDQILVGADHSVMCIKKNKVSRQLVLILAGVAFSSPVFAYIGPGAGLSAIGSVLALIGAVLLMILGFVWYPVKRLMANRKQESIPSDDEMEFSEVDDFRQTGDVDIEKSNQS